MSGSDLITHLADEHGTPLFVIDHAQIRENYAVFKNLLPRVQIYYAIKANPDPAIVKTLFDLGAGFDVSSMQEFMLAFDQIQHLPEQERLAWVWDNIIYANPIKPHETLMVLNKYRPLVTFDNYDELLKIKHYAPKSGLILRLRVPNVGAMVELSSKFGAEPEEAVDLIFEALNQGLTVEGLSFHVGSQTTQADNFIHAIDLAANIFKKTQERGYSGMKILDIGGGFPAPYDDSAHSFEEIAHIINHELDKFFPPEIEIMAEPGRYLVATAGTSISKIIGKSKRHGKLCYYINDGVYHTFSGIIFDHCQYHFNAIKNGPSEICTVFGPTCDGLDVVSKSEQLPSGLERGDLLVSNNIGAYSGATSTHFNGLAPAKVIHLNQ